MKRRFFRRYRRFEWFPSPKSRSDRIGVALIGISLILGVLFFFVVSQNQ
jgi:hypothetical protein